MLGASRCETSPFTRSLLRRHTGKCGLRDYKLKPQVWGGREDCEHEWTGKIQQYQRGQVGSHSTLQGGSQRPESKNGSQRIPQGQFCSHCSAWLGGLGLEPTPDLYVQHVVEVFRKVRRVLRSDGTCWVNLGDSYAGQGGPQVVQTINPQRLGGSDTQNSGQSRRVPASLKPKDLCLIPARVALALQADGWWVRSEIIWSKPNPMPESVTDRPTTAHEKIFLLTKSAKYFWDQEAVRESDYGSHNIRSVWEIATQGFSGSRFLADYVGADGKPYKVSEDCPLHGPRHGPEMRQKAEGDEQQDGNKTKCLCQEIKTDHFATFPEEIPLRCIKAGTSEKGVCPKCGAPWVRVIEKLGYDQTGAYGSNALGSGSRMFIDRDPAHDRPKSRKKPNGWQDGPGTHDRIPMGNYGGKWSETDPQGSGRRISQNTKAARDNGGDHDNPFVPSRTIGWKPSCKCGVEERKPAVVFDPFAGSGTTPLVADKLGRIGIGLDLKWDYCRMAEKRCREDAPLLVVDVLGAMNVAE